MDWCQKHFNWMIIWNDRVTIELWSIRVVTPVAAIRLELRMLLPLRQCHGNQCQRYITGRLSPMRKVFREKFGTEFARLVRRMIEDGPQKGNIIRRTRRANSVPNFSRNTFLIGLSRPV